MSKELLNIYKELIRQNKLKIDVVGYPDYDSIEEYKKIFPNSYKKYNQHFKIQGLKMILDGSPQGRTAWMKEPYEIEKQDIAENKTEKQENIKTKETYEEEEYKGYLAMKYADIVRNIKYGFCLSMFENIEVIYNYEKISRIRYFLYFCLKSIKA